MPQVQHVHRFASLVHDVNGAAMDLTTANPVRRRAVTGVEGDVVFLAIGRPNQLRVVRRDVKHMAITQLTTPKLLAA